MKKNYGFNDYKFFTEMSKLAVRHQSFDLSLGLPDFEIDDRLRHYLKESADVITHSYESLSGNLLLIENIVKFNSQRINSLLLKKEEVNIVPCSTFALYTSLKSILEFGDEVIVIQPSYYTYAPSIVLNGGVPVYYDLDNDFAINWEKLQNCISSKTKAIIVNSPQNPTGKMWTAADWERLYQIIKNQEIYLISEEIYDIYCYDEIAHYSPFLHPELKKRTFSIFSFGKMFHATGWKVSYLLSSEDLLENFRSHQQYISYSSNAPCQYAIARYLEVFDPAENKKVLENKRNIFNELAKNTPLEIEQKAEGGFFQLVNFRNISKDKTDVEFSKWLTVEKKVSCLPLSAFYNSKQNSDYVRFSFAKRDVVIIQAMDHLRKNL
ncbi:aminotransferase class I/II-fold pyridoxal phosphate-dependent enzyme [Chryseobacterium wangxinyae]|uniref:aminotransferase class I/II-fold pyridoxal phosphate-dependent enzyme n=1 Tax=Chryseobacterium sp. CY353 TaxID=2997334 RepID=UPI0022701051|nr:aminotransferase class I/II-fold pyridoxal phosphate-dependent enzyme [Chryseobacterium sp. CY353]MCY0968470.1 aminotransferase class I/II-fold pyridoxal phosphate-dependent enzyme [Chryseobacterium sp. CY353]